jgi:hypothetical protein
MRGLQALAGLRVAGAAIAGCVTSTGSGAVSRFPDICARRRWEGGTFVLRHAPHPPVPTTVDVVVTVEGAGITHNRTINLTLPAR